MGRAPVAVAMATVADGAVLLDRSTGTFYHVNPAGALAYTLLRTGRCSVADTARALAAAFQIDEAATRIDVEAFADDLARNRLVPR